MSAVYNYDLVQGSDEWLKARLGIITMSEVECLLVAGKSASGLGVGALTYANRLVAERITGEPADEFQGNRYTERGHELEPVARELYSSNSELEVIECGFITNHGVGYSPDSLPGDGLLEIKTKTATKQVEIILSGEVPKEHIPQCQGGLWVSGRDWIDFVSYARGLPLFIKRIERDEDVIRKIADGCERLYEEVDRRMKLVMEY